MFFSFLTNLLKVCVGILRFWFDPDNSAKVITLREISRDLWNYVYIGRALNTVINNVKVKILFRPKLFSIAQVLILSFRTFLSLQYLVRVT